MVNERELVVKRKEIAIEHRLEDASKVCNSNEKQDDMFGGKQRHHMSALSTSSVLHAVVDEKYSLAGRSLAVFCPHRAS